MVLIVVLWILVILTILALGLARQTRMELALNRYFTGEIRSHAAAVSGVFYAMSLIRQDSADKKMRLSDTLHQCGIVLPEGRSRRDLLAGIPVGEDRFDISYRDPSDPTQVIYGFRDEERRIDVNELNKTNITIFKDLIMDKGFDPNTAETIASSLLDWTDEDNQISNGGAGAEDNYYMSLPIPYHCKNGPLDSLQELRMLKGMTPQIFNAIKNDVTVFPQHGHFMINFDTASLPVLRAFAESLTGGRTNTRPEDAASLAAKIVAWRDNQGADEGPLEMRDLDLNPKERVLFLLMSSSRTRISNVFRIDVHALDPDSGVTTDVEAIVDRRNLAILSWHQS